MTDVTEGNGYAAFDLLLEKIYQDSGCDFRGGMGKGEKKEEKWKRKREKCG